MTLAEPLMQWYGIELPHNNIKNLKGAMFLKYSTLIFIIFMLIIGCLFCFSYAQAQTPAGRNITVIVKWQEAGIWKTAQYNTILRDLSSP